MFGLFKKTTKKQKLEKKVQQLQKEAFQLSKVDRTKSEAKLAEAQKLIDQIESIQDEEQG